MRLSPQITKQNAPMIADSRYAQTPIWKRLRARFKAPPKSGMASGVAVAFSVATAVSNEPATRDATRPRKESSQDL